MACARVSLWSFLLLYFFCCSGLWARLKWHKTFVLPESIINAEILSLWCFYKDVELTVTWPRTWIPLWKEAEHFTHSLLTLIVKDPPSAPADSESVVWSFLIKGGHVCLLKVPLISYKLNPLLFLALQRVAGWFELLPSEWNTCYMSTLSSFINTMTDDVSFHPQ